MTNVFYSVILNEKESKKTENVTMPKVKASVKEVSKEIAKNIPWDGMEFFLYEVSVKMKVKLFMSVL